jgi:hypothetical protein
MNVVTMLPATWDAETGTLAWPTGTADFGLYDVGFQLRDTSVPSVPPAERMGRYVVRFADSFSAFTAYSTHEVHLDWCCEGPVNYVLDPTGTVLHAYSDFFTDVHGWAYRVFDHSELPFAGVAFELRAYDVVVGPACGPGSALALYDVAVTDPAVVWPSWGNELPEVLRVDAPSDGFDVVSGIAPFPAASVDLTLSILHWDVSNICSVDGYWDYVIVTPLDTIPTP